jgi:hypothetical protein
MGLFDDTVGGLNLDQLFPQRPQYDEQGIQIGGPAGAPANPFGPSPIPANVAKGPFPNTPQAPLAATIPQNVSPVSMTPEALAANAAARGVPPPPVDLAPDAGPTDVGAALTGNTVPLPRPRPQGTDVGAQSRPGAPMDITSDAQKAGAGADGKKPSFLDALKGVKAPPNPEVQKISTPAAPRPTTAIKGGDLMALLTALNAAPGAGGIKLPSTLGQALGK